MTVNCLYLLSIHNCNPRASRSLPTTHETLKILRMRTTILITPQQQGRPVEVRTNARPNEPRSTNCEPRSANRENCEPRSANCELRTAKCEPRTAKCEPRTRSTNDGEVRSAKTRTAKPRTAKPRTANEKREAQMTAKSEVRTAKTRTAKPRSANSETQNAIVLLGHRRMGLYSRRREGVWG